MRIVSEARIRTYCEEYQDAKAQLMSFLKVAKTAEWSDLRDVRRTYPHADAVVVRSGRIATVFNIKGNKYRLITAIHYNAGRLFVMQFLPHDEYSRGAWKEHL